MRTSPTLAPSLLVNLYGVHPSGCQSPANTLKRGHRTAAVLFFAAALTTGSLLLLCPASAHAQGGVPLWTNLFRGSGAPARMAVDRSGNVVVAGNPQNGSSHDYAIVAYSNAGVPLWTNYYDGPAHLYDIPRAIAVDHSGNVFVTGDGENRDGSNDFATLKYSNAGVPLWTNRFGGGGGIAVDTSGNVIVTGGLGTIKYSNAGVPLWTNLSGGVAIALGSTGNVFVTGSSWNGSNNDYATVAYSNAGVPLWTNRYNGPGNNYDVANAIALDSSGNVFVTGYSSNGTNEDYATIAYSSAGLHLWTRRYNGPANDYDLAYAIAVDSNGNVFVTGTSVTVQDFISNPPDFATIKYSNSGVPLWTNRYNGPANGSDVASAITVDSGGSVFVTGQSVNDAIANPADVNYATVAYSNSGLPLWTNRYNRPEHFISHADAIAVDDAGNVFVAGSSQSNDDNYYYTATIKYSSSFPPPIHLDFQLLDNQLVLSWTNAGFTLQSAPALTGPFTNLPAATSPYTNSLTAPQQFFRLISN